MTESIAPKLAKWPFLLGDLCLLALAGFTIYRTGWPLGIWPLGFCFAAVALGAWMSILPFLREYHASLKLAEATTLSTAVAQLQNIEQIKNQIANATSQWQFVQDESKKTVAASKEIADRMRGEVREFCAFMDKANETEKSHLRLEVEKLRRAEGEWLQVVVRVLDHIFALNQAAARSGQPGLISQLGQFQHACRDAARRVGLIPYAPARQDPFDPKAHEPADDKTEPPPGAQVIETIASGYSFQGRLIRKALVTLKPDSQPELPLISPTTTPVTRSQPSNAEPQETLAEQIAQPVAAS